MDEPIEMPFGIWTLMVPKNCELDRDPDPHIRRCNFEWEKWSAQVMSGGQYSQSDSAGSALIWFACQLACTRSECTLNRPCAAVMRPYYGRPM